MYFYFFLFFAKLFLTDVKVGGNEPSDLKATGSQHTVLKLKSLLAKLHTGLWRRSGKNTQSPSRFKKNSNAALDSICLS